MQMLKKKDRLHNWFRKYHKWPALIFAIFILLFSFTGIIFNHREFFSSIDINRKWLPQNYQYANWNLGAVKSAVRLPDDSLLLFGNIGVWKTDSNFSAFSDFNKGFSKGVDNRRISSLLYTHNHRLLAGTLFGLYEYDDGWKKINIPVTEDRIVKIIQKNDSLLVMTRSYLLNANLNDKNLKFNKINVLPGKGSDHQVGLLRTLQVIHSGEIFGTVGKFLIDLAGLIFILITLSGIFYWLAPHLFNRVMESSKSKIKRVNRFSFKWHNKLGYWSIIILLLITLTGMFLRPPLSNPFLKTIITKIKYSTLENPNPWFGKFRDFLYDEKLKRFVISTSDGMFYADNKFGSSLHKYSSQPPIGMMGINVFENMAKGDYLVGSWIGLFRWVPEQGIIEDNITHLPFHKASMGGSHVGANVISGFISTTDGRKFVFDYNGKATPIGKSGIFPTMPLEIINQSPISLWSLSMEIHVGRFWKFILGEYYTLFIPLTGFAIVLVLVTGFFSFWIPCRRRLKNKRVQNKMLKLESVLSD